MLINLFGPRGFLLKNPEILNWRELLVRFALVFFCFALWPKGFMYWGIGLLVLAWWVDGGIFRFFDLIKEPLVLGVLVFCGMWGLGLLWGDSTANLHGKWIKYFVLLTFFPLFSLLNKERLFLVIGALLCSYLGMVSLGSYQWVMQESQGVPLLGMSYLNYSSALGIGVILAVFWGHETLLRKKAWLSISLWMMAILLLFLQFNQNARGVLLATLAALLLMMVFRYQVRQKMLMTGLVSIMVLTTLFAINSNTFYERLQQAGTDLQLFQQGNYQTSIGYRLAMWDVGLHSIAEHPLLGHGSGKAGKYFEDSIVTYKQGIYRNLPEFQAVRHFHNELIEIGMNLGLLGVLAFVYLLWSWFQTFKQRQMALLGGTIIFFIFVCGLTDVFLLYSRILLFLLTITTVSICWYKYYENPNEINWEHGGDKKSGK